VIDLSPGWRTERAYHGFAAGLIMEGEVTYRIGADRKSYKPGGTWVAQAGTAVTEENNTPKHARIFMSYLVRKGATLKGCSRMWNKGVPLCVLLICRRGRRSERVVYWSLTQLNAEAHRDPN